MTEYLTGFLWVRNLGELCWPILILAQVISVAAVSRWSWKSRGHRQASLGVWRGRGWAPVSDVVSRPLHEVSACGLVCAPASVTQITYRDTYFPKVCVSGETGRVCFISMT